MLWRTSCFTINSSVSQTKTPSHEIMNEVAISSHSMTKTYTKNGTGDVHRPRRLEDLVQNGTHVLGLPQLLERKLRPRWSSFSTFYRFIVQF